MKKHNGTQSLKLERKAVERNRRVHMKGLCFKLSSLIPSHRLKHSKDMLSQIDQLDHAAAYIKHLTERIDKLKKIKEQAMESNNSLDTVIEVRDMGSSIEVVLISGLKRNFMLCEVIAILEKEGAEVVSASFSTAGGKVFHIIHAQVKICRVGVETSRVRQRLQKLNYWSCM